MDAGPVRERPLTNRPPPLDAETDAVVKEHVKEKNATYFTADQLDAIANGPLGNKPLELFIGSIQEALKMLKAKKK